MARRKTRTVYRYRKAPRRRRKSYGSRKFTSKPIVKNAIDGMMTAFINGFIPQDAFYGVGHSIAPLVVGHFRRNQVLMTLAGIQLGGSVAEAIGQKVGLNAKRWL